MPSTTLRRRLTLQIILMITGVLLMACGALWGLDRIRENLDVDVRGFRQLRSLYEISYFVSWAQQSLQIPTPDEAKAQRAVRAAIAVLRSSDVDTDRLPLSQWEPETKAIGSGLLANLEHALAGLNNPEDDGNSEQLLDRALQALAMTSHTLRQDMSDQQQLTAAEREVSLALNASLAAILTGAVIWVGCKQYRMVIGPLDWLGGAVQRLSRGDFSGRIEMEGDREFVRLADDFNQMAVQLHGLYHQLEEKVASKSKELVRSERLASLGYLAAGVAHEINNPLGIIAGYGERSLQRLESDVDETKILKTREALRIMCEEAFRCKAITGRLLQLARSGNETREQMSLLAAAQRVITLIGGLPHFADRAIELEADGSETFDVIASIGEIKQVLVNLLVNALEAGGEVRIKLVRQEREVAVSVIDTGRGMTIDTLERVFEPFNTDKRSGRGGLGLGLSITHAIVKDHGGRITAQSEGLGCGSRFIVVLPAATVGGRLAWIND